MGKWSEHAKQWRRSDNRRVIIWTVILTLVGVAVLLGLLAFLSGCTPATRDTVANLAPATAAVKGSGTAIQAAAKATAEHLDTAERVVADAADTGKTDRLAPEALPAIDAAQESNAQVLTESSILLGPVMKQLTDQTAAVKALQKDRDTLAADLEKEKARGMAILHWLLAGLIVLGVLGLGASGFVAFKVDMKSGLAGAVASMLVICPAIFVLRFERYLVWAGGLICLALVAAIGIAVYSAWKQGKFKVAFASVGQALKTATPGVETKKVLAVIAATAPADEQAEYERLVATGAIPKTAAAEERNRDALT